MDQQLQSVVGDPPLAKVGVEGSNPFARSITTNETAVRLRAASRLPATIAETAKR